jgi:hypothetical protein
MLQDKMAIYGGATISATGQAVSWLDKLNDYLQAASLIVAIVAGLISIYYAVKRRGG